MKRNLLKTLCVALIATFSAVAAWGKVTWYPLYINGVQVTSKNCNNLASISGVDFFSGNVHAVFKYEPKSNTLIMNGVKTSYLDGRIALQYTGDKELKVQVSGKNQLNSQVFFDGPATIEGDGLLEINPTSSYSALVCNKGVYVKDCKLKASGLYGIWTGPDATIWLYNAVVVAYGTRAAVALKGHFQGTKVWTTGELGSFNSEGYPITKKGKVMKHLEFVNYDPNKVLLHEDFESGTMPEGWGTKDNDGDGFTWKPLKGNNLGRGFHGSEGVLYSHSWLNGGDLDPSNFLISPKIEGANRIRFHVYAWSPEHFKEHYWLTYNTSDDIEYGPNWKELKGSDWRITEGAKWFTKEYDLPEGTKYVGFTHGWSKGQNALLLDDIIFFGKKPHGAVAVTPADEAEATIVGYYTIDGRRHNQPQSGVNIVKMSNGKAKKVLFP